MSLVVIAMGIVIGIVAVVAIALPVSRTLTSTEYIVPGTLHLHLRDNQYIVYQQIGTNRGFGGFDRDVTALRIPPSAVSVLAPDGTRVPVFSDGSDEELTRGSTVYAAVLAFDPPFGGDYELRFTNAVQTRVVVARPVTDVFESVLVWFGVGALGGFVIVIGIVILIVGATRRGRAKRAMYAGYGGAPGWYGGTSQQWGTPGVTAPYPQQYPSQYPPGSYAPPGYPPTGYAPPGYPPPAPPPAANYTSPPPPSPEPPAGYPPPPEPPAPVDDA